MKPLVVQIQVPNSAASANLSRSQASNSFTHSSPLQPSSSRFLVVSAGRKTDIICRSWGSRPPAEITFWKSSRRLPTCRLSSVLMLPPQIIYWEYVQLIGIFYFVAASRSHYTSSQESESAVSPNDATNLTVSVLSYTAAPEDDGVRLTCRADNLQLNNEELEDSVTISVRCKWLRLGGHRAHINGHTLQVCPAIAGKWPAREC